MAMILHQETGLPIGDPELNPLPNTNIETAWTDLQKALSSMILSGSGWRSVFASGEENHEPDLAAGYAYIAAAAACSFCSYLKEKTGQEHPGIIIGMDSRPTGRAIADIMVRVCTSSGCQVDYGYIMAAPEIMAYTRIRGAVLNADAVHGFMYISASHNPVGHNGLKFGLTDGGVIGAEESSILIEKFRLFCSNPDCIESLNTLVQKADKTRVKRIFQNTDTIKKDAFKTYHTFIHEVVCADSDPEVQEKLYTGIRKSLSDTRLGILADFNGSARTLAPDRLYLESLGIRFWSINDKAGAIAHRIVPEGSSLDDCRKELERLHAEDSSFMLGYVPDCDGDRGNMVIWDSSSNSARSLEAQEVFALCVLSELAYLVWNGKLSYDLKGNARTKAAIAINDPTSMRIDKIAHAFDVSVFRAEVGEANVVNLARKLRTKGYLVRILGEGAAGGNITHPSAVRDPLASLSAIIKLLLIRSEEDKPGLFELWCDLSGQSEAYHSSYTLNDIIATLPAYTSTSAYSDEALLKITSTDHTDLKRKYQQLFYREWELKKTDLQKKYGIIRWEARAYKGMEEIQGVKDFGIAEKGGLKILFYSNDGHCPASIWMRGSGTEPVFRIMAETEGSDKRLERELLQWQSSMVQEADSL